MTAKTMLVIDTRAPAPRRVGGGLDSPHPSAETGRHRGRRPRRAPGTDRPAPPAKVTGRGTAERLPAVLQSNVVEVTKEPDTMSCELHLVRTALAALLPVSDDVPPLVLVQLLATKLDGHGAHCAVALNPPRGSLSPDYVRARCISLLLALDPAERRIVVALLAATVEGASCAGGVI
jgi:hypothetical protein